jgi:hypothetical protein
MKSYGDALVKLAGYAEDEDDLNIIQKSFWSDLRSCLFKKICKGEGGRIQWDFITGKRHKYADGRRIWLSDRNKKILEDLVAYFSTEEGREELAKYDINPIEDTDELMAMLANAIPDRDMKREEFRLFLKYKSEIMQFLLR